MGIRWSSCGGKVRKGNEDEEPLVLEELSNLFKKAEPCCCSHSADDGFSLELVNRSLLLLIKYVNRQSMELRRVHRRRVREHGLLSSLGEQFLPLCENVHRFLEDLVTKMKSMNEELVHFLDAIQNWTPSQHGQEEMLERLRRFQSRESFSGWFLESFRDLMEQHQGIEKMVQSHGASLQKKVKKLKRLRKVIYAIFAGLFVALLICSILVVALHAAPVLASIAAAAISAWSWGPLALWVDRLRHKTLNELRQRDKGLCNARQGAEDLVLRELQPCFRLVNRLKQRLDSNACHIEENHEIIKMKGRLEEALCGAINCVKGAIEKVEDRKKELDGNRMEFLNWMNGGGSADESSPTRPLLGSLKSDGILCSVNFSSCFIQKSTAED